MTAAPPLPATDLAEAAAWEAQALASETARFRVLAWLGAAVVPLWIGFDAVLQPALVRPFALLRLTDVAVCLLALRGLARPRSLVAVRRWGAAAVVVTGVAIALMLPLVRAHYDLYVLGFSTVFLAVGAIASWPARYTAASFGAVAAAYAAALAVVPAARPALVTAGATFYIATLAVIVAAQIALRARLEHRAFVAAHRLARRNDELAEALGRLTAAQARLVESEKLAALGRLLAGLSHEINNPINVVHNNLDPMRQHLADLAALLGEMRAALPAVPPALRERWEALDMDFLQADFADALDSVDQAVQRIRVIHADLRAFVRGDARVSVVGDPNEGLRATVAMLRRGLRAGVTLDAEYGALPPVVFHAGQLNQVFLNLVQNALEAAGEGGRVVVRSGVREGWVRFDVEDNGAGIVPEAAARLFEPFYTTKAAGTGLGLATSYQIVTAHGGSIHHETPEGGGARFVVTLPVAPPAPAPRGGRALQAPGA